MAYAGETYGTGGVYAGQAANAINPVSANGVTTERAAAGVVIGSLVALIMIRRGFRGVSIGRLSGGLVKG
jgi:hypothetical protein